MKPSDVPQILEFIKVAAEEQAPGTKVAATVSGLTQILNFGPPVAAKRSPSQVAWALLIETPSGETAGMLIYLFNSSTWSAAPGLHVEELYVAPKYRRDGYAKRLFDALATAAQKAGCVKIDWICLQNNENALRFYDKMGAGIMSDWATLRLAREGIEKLAQESA